MSFHFYEISVLLSDSHYPASRLTTLGFPASILAAEPQ